MILPLLHMCTFIYFYLTMQFTAKNIHMTETVNNTLEMIGKQPKFQHLPSETMQNQENSQTQQ
jgi:hypothetical protein